MLGSNVWRKLLGVDRQTVIEAVDFDEEADAVVVHVRPRRATKRRCGLCGKRAPGYDQGVGRRNWRAIDVGILLCHLQADAPRVNYPEHGPTVAQVPWARHGAGHTREVRAVIRGLVQPDNRRLHMVDERPRRRTGIVAAVVATGIEVAIYDAGRLYRTDREARSACLAALVDDLAATGDNIQLVIERDDSLVRAVGMIDTIEYRHERAYESQLLALPDLAAWCWARSGEWRRQIGPILTHVRQVGP